MEEAQEYQYKIVIIGDSGVGKSCLLQQYLRGVYDPDHPPTVGVEFGTKNMEIDGAKIKMQVWDTAGQEQFKSITRSYYRGVAGALVVYDITNEKSFNNVKTWLEEAQTQGNPNMSIVLCGNKLDAANKRAVTESKAASFADLNGVSLLEVSAKSNIRVEEAFEKLARGITTAVKKGKIDPTEEDSGVRLLSAPSKAVEKRQKLLAEKLQKKKQQEEESQCC